MSNVQNVCVGWLRRVKNVRGVTIMLEWLVNCFLKSLEGNLTRWQKIVMRSRSNTLII